MNLPALVVDLTAERVGDRVLLHWTTPSLTTDDLPIKGNMTAEICRETGPKTATPAGRLTPCTPVLRLAVPPGDSQVADTLPRPLSADPVGLIMYRVRIFNAANRSAGDSPGALAASGAAPPPLEGFIATASETDAVLEWRTPQPDGKAYLVDIAVRNLSTVPSPKAKGPGNRLLSRQGRSQSVVSNQSTGRDIHLRTPDAESSAERLPADNLSGTLDPTAKMGDTYIYTAERVRPVTAGGHLLEIHSEPSPAVTLTMRDTFPPHSPSGLAAISSVAGEHLYIDLSWEPNTEPDMAGYFVYRQFTGQDGTPQGPRTRLNRIPISAPAYRDMAVTSGQRYSYRVSAVDATGNESAPSDQAQEVLASPN